MIIKKLQSQNGNVWKYIFKFDDAIAESVLYKYNSFEKRTVICCSVQSGCPVGCTFCGTGKHFIRNLKCSEIIAQIEMILLDMNIKSEKVERLQFMFMSMGEPMLNWEEVYEAIENLEEKYHYAELLISTIGIKDDSIFEEIKDCSWAFDNVGLQFSIHHSTDKERNKLIPYKNKYSLFELRDQGIQWFIYTGKKPYINYCISPESSTKEALEDLKKLFPKDIFNYTFSVVCSKEKGACPNNSNYLEIVKQFKEEGYNVRGFNPAGQDDIGGGCGQLWYVQEYFKNRCIK